MLNQGVCRLKITWLGHASFLFEASGKNIYIDPYTLRGNPKTADLILITHDHYDHYDIDSINRIRKPGTHILGPENVAKKIHGAGILRKKDIVHIEDTTITAVPSYNTEKSFHPAEAGLGFVIEHEGKKVYHSGDTDLIPEMEELKNITIALLPISGTYTMNSEEAVDAVKLIKPEIAIPMHYGKIFGSRADADRFKSRIEKETKTKVEILENKSLEI